MVTQKLGEVLNLFGNSPQSSISNASKDVFGSGDFGSYLNNSLKSSSGDAVKVNTSNKSTKTEENKIDYKPSYSRDKQVPTDKQPVKSEKPRENKTDAVNQKSTSEKNKNVTDAKTVQKNESKEIPDAIAGKVEELSGKIEDVVKDALGITSEELEGLMEFLGMQMTDLLNINNLKLLALAANGETDFTALLTNESISSDLDHLIKGIEQINLEEFGLTNEDLASFMESQQETPDFSLEEEKISHLEEKEVSDTGEESRINKVVSETVPLLNAEEADADNQNKVHTNSQSSDDSTIKFEVEKTAEHMEAGVGNENKDNSAKAEVGQNTGLEQVIGNIAANSGKGTENFIEQLSAARQTRNIVNQIVDEIKVTVKPTETSMELQLNPASLGKVNLTVVAKDGVLTAQFTVQNAVAKEAIESQLQNLKDNLSNQGIKVEAVEVTVSNFSFDGSNQADGNAKEQKQSHRKRNIDEIDDLDNLEADTKASAERMQMNGSTVEYSA